MALQELSVEIDGAFKTDLQRYPDAHGISSTTL